MVPLFSLMQKVGFSGHGSRVLSDFLKAQNIPYEEQCSKVVEQKQLEWKLLSPWMQNSKEQYYNVINQVISYWPSYRSEVCCIGPRRSRGPIQLTEDL